MKTARAQHSTLPLAWRYCRYIFAVVMLATRNADDPKFSCYEERGILGLSMPEVILILVRRRNLAAKCRIW